MRKYARLLVWKLAVLSFAAPFYVADAQTQRLENPLKVGSLTELVQEVLRIIVIIGTPVAALFIIYSGFLFVTARGNTDQLDKAKKSFFGALVGTSLLLGAWVIAQAIGGTVEQVVR